MYLAQESEVFHPPGVSFLLILHTYKNLENCAFMIFPDFQRLLEWCQSYFTNMFLKTYI